MTDQKERTAPVHLVWLIARREITTRLRSRAFLVSMGALLALVFAGVTLAGIASGGGFSGTRAIAVSADAVSVIEHVGLDLMTVEDDAVARQLVEDGKAEAAVVSDSQSPTGFTVIADHSVPAGIVQSLSITPHVEVLHPFSDNAALAQVAGMVFGVIFMWSGVTFGSTIAQSVVEEKQTRIVEILLATVPARTLFAGKVTGNATLALMTVVLAIALAVVGAGITGQDLPFDTLGSAVAWFAVMFALGFVMLACVYGALAALVSRHEDVGAVISPVSLLIMAPYLLAVMFADNPALLAVMSYFPLSSPIAMPLRLFLGIAAPWEPWAGASVLIITILLVWVLGARIYRNAVLRVGARVKLADAVRP